MKKGRIGTGWWMVIILVILILIIIVISILPEEGSVNNENQSIQLNEESVCQRERGEWKQFPNSCVDSCQYVRYPAQTSCAVAITFGCDCGNDRCWDGTSCVAN